MHRVTHRAASFKHKAHYRIAGHAVFPTTTFREIPMDNKSIETTANRRSFLKNLSFFGAASVPAALLARNTHAAAPAAVNEPLQLAQAETPKPAPRPAAAPVEERGDFATLQDIVFAAKRDLRPKLWTHLTGGSE